jgi:diguanylate cyclase (GGDEF)-like protein/PAS domain S-box-containing protein
MRTVLYVSPAYEVLWGQPCTAMYADPLAWTRLIHPDDRERVLAAANAKRALGDYDEEYRIVRVDGSVRHIRDRAFPIRDRAGRVYRIAGIAQDITARKEQEAQIRHLAYHDALTGLPNRALVMNRLEQAIAHAQRHRQSLAVLFLDLDRFKTINDTLGHPAGDKLLKQVAERLTAVLREEDTVGRVGGDEFLMVVPGLESPEDAAHVANKALASMAKAFAVSGQELHASGSIGISFFPRDSTNAETLVKYADTALYLAKEQGRNTFRFFSPDLDARVRERLVLENELRRAIDRDQLRLHYQPQVELASGRVTGVEALVRWQHGNHGLIAPSAFIPVAEETGLVVAMGEWVLRTACRQARAWKDAGLIDLRVSVNLSGRQLERQDLAAVVRRVLAETGCDPQLIELEVTESSLMANAEQAAETLLTLHRMGVQLAMDDFGTGYSSLAHLKRFPLHRLKIDKTFISGIPGDENDTAIVQAIIAMARQLRLRVVAEGVETEGQRAFLAANGCDEMQGYLFGMPKEADQVTALLTGQVLSGGPRATDLVVTGALGELLDDRSA